MYIASDAHAHHPTSDAQLVPWAVEEREMNTHPLKNSCSMSYGVEHLFCQFNSAVLTLLLSQLKLRQLGK